MPSLEIHGVELSWWEQGSGPPLLCLHETATCAEVWRPLAGSLGEAVRLIAPDRRGWGSSGAPQSYLRTTVEEQAEDAVGLIETLGLGSAILCGAGLGAVAALDLVLRRPELVSAAVLIEPPLLAFLPEATEGLSSDRVVIGDAVAASGPEGGLELYLAGGLAYLGAGAGRIPAELAAIARRTPLSLFAELAAVPGWAIAGSRLTRNEVRCTVVVGASTPPLLRAAAGQLVARLGEAEQLAVGGEGLPQIDAAAELAAAISELAPG